MRILSLLPLCLPWLLVPTATAQNLLDRVAGTIDLTKWQQSQSFLTTQRYEGTLALIAGKPDINHEKSLDRRFNCFTPHAHLFSDPDQPRPSLPAVYQITLMKGGNVGIGHMAILDPEAAGRAHLVKRVASLADFKRLLPNCIPSFIEPTGDDDPELYWYSWATLDERGVLTVHYVEAEQDPKSGFGLWMWKGTFQPLTQAKRKAKAP